MPVQPLEIVYKDDYLVAINKPHGLLVHKSSIAGDAQVFAIQMLRDQLGQWVYPVHRLDRKTAGVLLFALQQDTAGATQSLFAKRKVEKTYRAIVRGFTEDAGTIDRPLRNTDTGQLQDALTAFTTLARAAIPLPFGKHEISRYSLVEIHPHTGRRHQIRRHLAGVNHPIIGDRPHGCNKQNRLWKSTWGLTTMLLHAAGLQLPHPITGQPIRMEAPESAPFRTARAVLGFDPR